MDFYILIIKIINSKEPETESEPKRESESETESETDSEYGQNKWFSGFSESLQPNCSLRNANWEGDSDSICKFFPKLAVSALKIQDVIIVKYALETNKIV